MAVRTHNLNLSSDHVDHQCRFCGARAVWWTQFECGEKPGSEVIYHCFRHRIPARVEVQMEAQRRVADWINERI